MGRRELPRSYAMRSAKLTPARQELMDEQWASFAATPANCAVPAVTPMHFDIGCGKGESVLHYARQLPQSLQVAVEVYPPGVAALLAAAHAAGLGNIRIAIADARVILPQLAAPGSVAQIRVLFPDPWPKRRHRKRRLIDASFLQLAQSLLEPGGEFAFATDWREYYEDVRALAGSGWTVAAAGLSEQARGSRPETRFERRAQREGRPSFDLRLRAQTTTAAVVSVNTPSVPVANRRSATSGELTV